MINQDKNQNITDHLAEFWNEIGKSAGILQQHEGFMAIRPDGNSWPSKVFAVQPSSLTLELLKSGISNNQLPNAILVESEPTKELLTSTGFQVISSLKAMALNAYDGNLQKLDNTQFETVTTKQQAREFARIAAESFDYPVLATTVEALLEQPRFHMFLGKHEDNFGSCGMLYLDKKDVCGFHMIGALPNFRGKGLGKSMTQLLLNKTVAMGYRKIYLVASKSGAPIYSKLGFESFGNVETYALSN